MIRVNAHTRVDWDETSFRVWDEDDTIRVELPVTSDRIAEAEVSAAVFAAEAQAAQAHADNLTAAETCRVAMRDHTDALIEAQGHLVQDALTTGQIDYLHNDALALAVEPLVRQLKDLPPHIKADPRLIEQREDMTDQALALHHLQTTFEARGAQGLIELLGISQP